MPFPVDDLSSRRSPEALLERHALQERLADHSPQVRYESIRALAPLAAKNRHIRDAIAACAKDEGRAIRGVAGKVIMLAEMPGGESLIREVIFDLYDLRFPYLPDDGSAQRQSEDIKLDIKLSQLVFKDFEDEDQIGENAPAERLDALWGNNDQDGGDTAKIIASLFSSPEPEPETAELIM